MTKRRTLALSAGFREVGIACFNGKELMDYGVKSLRRSGNAGKRGDLLCAILERLLQEKQPDVLVLAEKSSSNAHAAIQKVRELACEARVPITAFALSTVREEIVGDGRATKRQVAVVLIGLFPELRDHRTPNRLWRERYYQRMFDAVALGFTYIRRYEKQRSQ